MTTTLLRAGRSRPLYLACCFAALGAAVACGSEGRRFDGAESSGGTSGVGGSGGSQQGKGGSGASTTHPQDGGAANPGDGGGANPGDGGTSASGNAGAGASAGSSDGEEPGKPCEEGCFCEGEYCATVTKITVSDRHSCALMGSGTLWCWGDNSNGQLGIAGFSNELLPKRLTTIEDVEDIAVGYAHSCAVKSDGTTWCWGSNTVSQLGDDGGVETQTHTPVQVLTAPGTALTGVQSIVTGFNHTCALKTSDGSVWCWGSGNLGNGSDQPSALAVRVVLPVGDPLLGASKIFAGQSVSGAFYSNTWYTWGGSTHGQGASQYTGPTSLAANPMCDDRDYTSLSIGQNQGCGVAPDGDLYCWNGSSYDGTPESEVYEHDQRTELDGNAREVGVGYAHYCVVKTDDVIACFGYEYGNGALGDGDNTSSETPIDILSEVEHMAASLHHTCVLRADQSVWCWGQNTSGQIGNGSADSTVTVPVQVLPVSAD